MEKRFSVSMLFVASCFALTQGAMPVLAHHANAGMISAPGTTPRATAHHPVPNSNTPFLNNTGLLPAAALAHSHALVGLSHAQHGMLVASSHGNHGSNGNHGSQSQGSVHRHQGNINGNLMTASQHFRLPGLISVPDVPGSDSAAAQQITDVVNGDWTAWTGSDWKYLTIQQVGALLKNPNVKGSQAAVLAMIASQMYSDAGATPGYVPAYSKTQVLDYLLGTSSDPGALFSGSQATQYYTSVMSQIASAKTPSGGWNLYGSYNGPQLSTIQQGMLGDCFFLSAVDSVLNQNPQLISNMISTNTKGYFVVSFPTGRNVQVKLTEGEVGTFSQAINNGAWLAIMGMAEDKVIHGQGGVPGCLKAVPLGVISDGGYPTQSLHLLTGVSYSDLGNSNLFNYSASDLNQILVQGTANNTPMNASSSDHAMSILSYNSSTQMLTILNPWGVSGPFGYNEDPGFNNPGFEVTMTNGVFHVSLSTLMNNFYSITGPTSLVGNTFPASFGGAHTSAIPTNLMTGVPHLSTSAAMVSLPGTMPSTVALAPQISSSLPAALNATTLTVSDHSPLSTMLDQNTANLSTLTGYLTRNDIASDTTPSSGAEGTAAYEAGEGTTLIANDTPVAVHTGRALVHVAPEAAALVIQLGDEVLIGNLCDKRNGDVTVDINGASISVPMGRAVLLGDEKVAEPGELSLSDCLEGGRPAVLGKFANSRAFMGTASYAWAFKNCPQFHEMIHSSDAVQRRIASKVLKAGAATMTLASQ